MLTKKQVLNLLGTRLIAVQAQQHGESLKKPTFLAKT